MNNHSPRFIDIAIQALEEGVIDIKTFARNIPIKELSDDQLKRLVPWISIGPLNLIKELNEDE